jgi:hypothetical protein
MRRADRKVVNGRTRHLWSSARGKGTGLGTVVYQATAKEFLEGSPAQKPGFSGKAGLLVSRDSWLVCRLRTPGFFGKVGLLFSRQLVSGAYFC